MTAFPLHLIALKMVVAAMFGLLLPQTNNLPMTKDEVRRLFNNLKNDPVLKDATKQAVNQRGVDFELDPATEREFKADGMDQALLNAIRGKARITTLTIQCEPVECEVVINDEVAGTTYGTVLTRSGVKPGPITIKVSAPPNYQSKTAEVRVSPGEHLRVPKFTLDPLTGGLAVACKPAPVCGITIKGPNGFAKTGEASQQRLTVQGLSLGAYEIEATAAPEFFPKTEKVWVSTTTDLRSVDIELDEDPWGSKTPLQVFDVVVGSLGGKEILSAGRLSKNTARIRLEGDPPSIGRLNAEVVETVAPNRLRWEMNIAGTRWKVNYDGTRVNSDGDKKIRGTPLAQELENSIRLFSAMRLPLVLLLMREKFDIKKGPNLVLIADAAEDRYTFQLNADFSPQKVIHEHLTPPRSREEMEFGQYKSIGQDLKLPHVLILRYPDRPKHEHIFQYDKIDIKAQVTEDQFKR